MLGQYNARKRDDEAKWRQRWQVAEQNTKDAVERAIKLEEERAIAKAEAEQRKREEEQRMKAEEQRRKEEEEQKREVTKGHYSEYL